MPNNGFWLSNKRPQKVNKIVSCVPSQTELLSYFQLNREVVGITLFCVHPNNWFKTKERIGGTKTLKIDKIKDLSPDLILANKEENVKGQLVELSKYFPVFVTDVTDFQSALTSITEIGQIVNRAVEANELVSQIKKKFVQLKINKPKKVVYLIWKNPYMTVGDDTFIHSMLKEAGFENCFASQKRYPEITIEDIKSAAPDLLFLSSEPFPFTKKHMQDFVTIIDENRINIVDGECFSWYGSHLLKAADYFENLNF